MILQETYTLANGIAIPKLGLGTWFIDNNKAAQAIRTAADLDYNNSESRVCREHADSALQDVALTSTAVESWERYDTVFVGYPIWWGGSAWPVNGFVKANDFTGKTVIPFCTSASSALGQSGETLAQLAGTGDWQEGQRFGSSAARSDVADWLTGLGFTVR